MAVALSVILMAVAMQLLAVAKPCSVVADSAVVPCVVYDGCCNHTMPLQGFPASLRVPFSRNWSLCLLISSFFHFDTKTEVNR